VRDREEGKGKLMREGKENERMYKLKNTTQEDRPALEKKDKSGGAERRKVVVITDGARTPEHAPPSFKRRKGCAGLGPKFVSILAGMIEIR
jgi:hypothetical protein